MRAYELIEVTPKLRITPEHRRQARASKHQMIVEFPVDDFLRMTTQTDEGLEQIMQATQTVLAYNRYAKSGENILMPFLAIDQDSRKITGHEGRHRAAAMKKGGAKTMPVAIRLNPGKELDAKYPDEYDPIYKAKFEDLPDQINGQYGRGSIPKTLLTVLVDGWDNMG